MSTPETSELDLRLQELARSPVLLVATDFDGTIAPIVPQPDQAEASREALVALRVLGQMPQTHVAVISGRALSDLAARTRAVEGAHLVGSHGSEFEPGFASLMDADARTLLNGLRRQLQEIALETPGCLLEEKPPSLAFHYRTAEDDAAERAVRRILDGPARQPGVHVRHGKKVIELSVVETNKGVALSRLRQRLGATAVLFLGDDATDEDAFATLGGPDVGVKVGAGPSLARHRTVDALGVVRTLADVAERRSQWLAGSHATPIERHSILSDQRTVALLDDAGRVVWMCAPRIDSAAVFAELLGGPTAGFFDVRPAGPAPAPKQSYESDTFILRTEWPGLSVTDYLDCSGSRPFQRAGRSDLIRVIAGRGAVRVAFAPRIDFGRVETRLQVCENGVVAEGAIDPLALRAPGLAWKLVDEGKHQAAVAEFELEAGPVVLELRCGTGSLQPDPAPESVRRERTRRFWSNWASTLSLPAEHKDVVLRSALLIKALTFGPTGAIAAAATTSLPEHAGGVRNWDYRFCWPRDAALAAASLVRLGATGPAIKLLDWLLGICEHMGPGALLNPVYTVTGGHLGQEGEIAELSGYAGSRPVRVGNAAAHQVQLDVFGPITELVALLAERGAALSSEHWKLVETMVQAVERRWSEADHGIWEVRLARRHHVHSKVMCWQALDRALRVAAYLGRTRAEWIALRDRMATDVLARGWSEERRAYCGSYEGNEADAATLSIGLSGLLPMTDPRFQATIRYVEQHLLAVPTVYRYRCDDGLPGGEGGFHLCTAWLIQAYARGERPDEAASLFDRLASLVGPTGLLSEEYDPRHGRALGNVPQAYSHLGLIDAALALTKA
ncbi:MAG: trehalose-phosphatase [Phycisphaerales bacterium]|nr:trehalose-phosphatase [Phycisphaerales bacterium]